MTDGIDGPVPVDNTDKVEVQVLRLAATRIAIRAAEWHLEQLIERAGALQTRIDDLPAMSEGNDPDVVEAARLMLTDPSTLEVLAVAGRARGALMELAEWKERSSAG